MKKITSILDDIFLVKVMIKRWEMATFYAIK